MLAYRIANCKYANEIEGVGAKLFGGRWNSVGVPMHYMASSRALAALEVLANKNSTIDAENLCVSVFSLPEKKVLEIKLDDLPSNWKGYEPNIFLRKIGDNFFKENKYFILKVPSAIIEDEFNYLINVKHPLIAELNINETKPFYFDNRLI